MSTSDLPSDDEARRTKSAATAGIIAEPVAAWIFRKITPSILRSLEAEACKKILGELATRGLCEVATEITMHVAISAITRSVIAGILTSIEVILGPIDWALVIFTIVGFIYDHIDPHHYKETYYRETVQAIQDQLETLSKANWFEQTRDAKVDFEYPMEVDGVTVYDSRKWKLDIHKIVVNSLSYTADLVNNLTVNSLGERIDEAVSKLDLDTDRRTATHPPSWNKFVNECIQSVIPSNARVTTIRRKLDKEYQQIDVVASMGWISFLTLGFTVTLIGLKGTTPMFTHDGAVKPKQLSRK